jgi:alkylation response protein AidB-like acyl-CoA dehydrogenase
MTGTRSDAAELEALRGAVRDLVGGVGGVAAARRRLDAAPGFDERAWQLLGTEMGLAGLGLPEQLGGAGAGIAELVTVADELGRALLPVPFFSSTVLAGQLLAGCGSDRIAELAGGAVFAFCGTDADGCWNPAALTVHAEGDRLTGTVEFVLDGAHAAQLVVAADNGVGCDLYLVAADADGLVRRDLETLDPSRSQATITFDDVAAQALTHGGAGAAIVAAALDVALVVLAAEQVGGAAACLDMAVDYAKIRHQFSRPIGSFQAIKHKLADLLLLVEMARSAVDRALVVADDPAALAEAAAVASVWCSEAFTAVATETVHVNGGTGFTWEHDAHLYFRRAKADEVLLGGPAFHRERLAALLGW